MAGRPYRTDQRWSKSGRAGSSIKKDDKETMESSGQSRQVSQKDLVKVATNMGKKWRQIGIQFLGVSNSRLEQIAEENPSDVVMRAFHMLLEWKNREKEKATTDHLYDILDQNGVPLDIDAYEFLIENF